MVHSVDFITSTFVTTETVDFRTISKFYFVLETTA